MSANRGAVAVLLSASFLFGVTASAGKFNKKLDVGDAAPSWKDLTGTDDKRHSLSDHKDAKAVVVTFTCNHCPVAQGYEERLIRFVNEYKDKGVAVVAISCSRFKADAFPRMKERAAASKFNFDYLHDATQQVAKDFGATATPHLFVLDGRRRIAYMGAFDDSLIESKVKRRYVQDAVDAVLAGKTPEIRETRQSGCPIEYE